MKLSQFRYTMPKDLIALRPAKQRDESRLMVVHRDTGEIEHRIFKEMIEYFESGDVIVANNTKVFPSLLMGEKEKTGASITVFLLRELNEETRLWDVIVDPARKIRIGNKLYFGAGGDELVAEVIDNTTSRGRTVRFLYEGSHDEFMATVKRIGTTPLPDELRKLRGIEKEDAERYQTYYAKVEGAMAAPSAGFHFSRELLKRLELNDVIWTELTLHAGIGNFKPIEVEDLSKHRMDAEEMYIGQDTCDIVNNAIQNHRHVCAVGVTTMKALETAVTIPGKISPYEGWSNKFIFPPYNFTIADRFISGFHPSMSSMFILASSFGGPELVLRAYQTAIKEKYRFGIYGDAMMII